VLDDGATLTGGEAARYQTRSLDATINWDTEHAYSTPGAPPNGSDYVRLRDEGGYLAADEIDSITFDGGDDLPPTPVEWTVDENPAGNEGDPALYSGTGSGFDRSIAHEVSVPQNNATLTLETNYDIEPGYDFGFVQISTDGGETWTSLANENTTSEYETTDADTVTVELIKENIPGLSSSSGGWTTETFDLTEYEGEDVLVGFRYITDPAVDHPGWWIDDVMVGNQELTDGSSLEGWQTYTEINPPPVEGWTVQLVAYDDAHENAWLARLELEDGAQATLEGDALRAAIGEGAETVAAIVTHDDPTEFQTLYAPYTLTVNGVTQPGG
jgi:hypothetical protein